MKLRRIAPAIGICLALVVGSPIALAEPADGAEPAGASEAAPQPEPETSASTTSSPPPTTPPPSTSPTPAPTSEPEPTSTPKPTTKPEPTSTPKPTKAPTSTPSTSPSSAEEPTEAPSTPRRPVEPEPLDPAVVADQLAQADTLLAELAAGNTALAALLEKLETLTDKANAALERKAEAERRAKDAIKLAKFERGAADRLAVQLEEKQQQLRQWAFSAYVDGGSTAEMVSVFDAMIKDPSEAGNPVGDLIYLTDERVRLLQDIRELTARQKAAADRAEQAVHDTEAAAEEAAKAQIEADEALEEHEKVIAAAQEDHVEALTDAAPLAAMLIGLASPEAKKRGEEILAALKEHNIDLPDLGEACSDDLNVYPNGQLPASALCPLWMAPEHKARPNAAVAFAAMSQKFAKDLGRPICVTSSYRTYADQIAVKAARGFWAAPPGTSNHGLGMALDLCGGIGSFGTIEHLWMKRNAPMFGWFHPSWAAANGRKPEPWHWEYAG